MTFLAVHHARKGNAGEGAEASLGSQSIAGSFDSTLILTRKPDSKGKIRFLNISSRFGYDPEIGERLAFQYDGNTMVTADPSAELDEEILEVLGDEAMTANEVRKALESEPSLRTLQRRLKVLTDSREVAGEGNTNRRKYTRTTSDIATKHIENPVSQVSQEPKTPLEPAMFPYANKEH